MTFPKLKEEYGSADRRIGYIVVSKIPQEDLPNLQDQMGKMAAYAPDWKGPITPEESVRRVLGVIEAASVERGDGGTFVSHFGNRQWL